MLATYEGEEPPAAGVDARGNGTRPHIRALLKQRTNGEPQRIPHRKLVLHDVHMQVARMGIVPAEMSNP